MGKELRIAVRVTAKEKDKKSSKPENAGCQQPNMSSKERWGTNRDRFRPTLFSFALKSSVLWQTKQARKSLTKKSAPC